MDPWLTKFVEAQRAGWEAEVAGEAEEEGAYRGRIGRPEERTLSGWQPDFREAPTGWDHSERAMSFGWARPIIEVPSEGGPMLLVPKQLLRSGMTGDVPYYGGRLTPAQAYAASHPSAPPPRTPAPSPPDALRALQYLLDTGVISPQEYQRFRARVHP